MLEILEYGNSGRKTVFLVMNLLMLKHSQVLFVTTSKSERATWRQNYVITLEAMADVANCGRSKRNKGIMAITVITEITAVKSGEVRQQEQQ